VGLDILFISEILKKCGDWHDLLNVDYLLKSQVLRFFICAIFQPEIVREQAVTQILKAGALYFALAFGAGFALGTIRVLWVAPQFGTRIAELMEAPFMLIVTIASARWIVRRLAVPPETYSRLGMGIIALGLLLTLEFTLVLWLRGLTIREYFANQDPVSGTVYYVMLGLFAVMPLLVDRNSGTHL